MTAIHQFMPSFVAHDAVGMHAARLRDLLRAAGFRSDIYADNLGPEVRREAYRYHEYLTHVRRAKKRRPGEDVWLLYHASTGSRVADFVLDRPEPLLVDYHNITPVGFFETWEPRVAPILRAGRDELRRLAQRCELGIADSTHNKDELVAAGFRKTVVVPILLDLGDYEQAPSPSTLARLGAAKADGGTDIVFVGRVAPNKCHHDLVASLAAFRRLYDPEARLRLVGGSSSHGYWRALEATIDELGLGGAVHMTGSVSFPDLLAHYRSADVFLCLSEHEGFCVPVVEAMHLGVPVVAYDSTAVPETVAGAGLVLADKDPFTVAAALDRVVHDEPLRASLVAAGRRRALDFALPRTAERMLDAIVSATGPPSD